MDFGGDFGSVLVEKNVWPFLVEKMGSPPVRCGSDHFGQRPLFTLTNLSPIEHKKFKSSRLGLQIMVYTVELDQLMMY